MLFLLSDGSDMAMPGCRCLCGMTGMSMFSESSFFLNLLFFRAGRPPSLWVWLSRIANPPERVAFAAVKPFRRICRLSGVTAGL